SSRLFALVPHSVPQASYFSISALAANPDFSASPGLRHFVVGFAGHSSISPVQLWTIPLESPTGFLNARINPNVKATVRRIRRLPELWLKRLRSLRPLLRLLRGWLLRRGCFRRPALLWPHEILQHVHRDEPDFHIAYLLKFGARNAAFSQPRGDGRIRSIYFLRKFGCSHIVT